MAVLTVQTLTKNVDVEKTAMVAAGAGGDSFANAKATLIEIDNQGGSPCVMTIDSIKACDQGSDHNLVVTTPAGEERFVVVDVARFNDTGVSGGSVALSYDQVTSVFIGVTAVPVN